MFNFFKRKSGCLDNKTERQKVDFFKGLFDACLKDNVWFLEQYSDLKPREQEQYQKWVLKTQNKKIITNNKKNGTK